MYVCVSKYASKQGSTYVSKLENMYMITMITYIYIYIYICCFNERMSLNIKIYG